MSREQFESRRFQAKARKTIEQANEIISEYQEQGLVLTLRQLFYQFVARGLIENSLANYKRLGGVVKNGRRAGLIDWAAIEDRTRGLRRLSSWDDPADLISSAARQYREDLWRGQIYRPEVWIEKDALVGVIDGVCEEFRVPYFACRGNNSETLQHEAGKRFAEYASRGLTPIVLHLGDHDPNGLDMTRDNRDRLAIFARRSVTVRRLALNFDQVQTYRVPSNFAKEADSRFAAYAKIYGTESWELDALDPIVIQDLIRHELQTLVDKEAWNAALAEEAENRAFLIDTSERWSFIRQCLEGAE